MWQAFWNVLPALTLCRIQYIWVNSVLKLTKNSAFLDAGEFYLRTTDIWLATGWTVRGLNPDVSEIFRTRPHRPWSPLSFLYNEYRVSCPGVKRLGRGVNHPPASITEVKEREEPYLYSLSGPSWSVTRWTFTYRATCCLTLFLKTNFYVLGCVHYNCTLIFNPVHFGIHWCHHQGVRIYCRYFKAFNDDFV